MIRYKTPALTVWLLGIILAAGISDAADRQQLPDPPTLLQAADVAYRTPRAGEEIRAEVFGRSIEVQPRDRRSTWSWDIGIEHWPGLDNPTSGIGYLYVWRHPDDGQLQRAVVSIIYNDFLLAQKIDPAGWEMVFMARNFSQPGEQTEIVDGQPFHEQELRWGYVQIGAGVGYRKQVAPGNQENMFAADLLLEPAYYYFSRGPETVDGFVVPRDTPEIRTHLQIRWDALERNLLELAHRGFGAGGDLAVGHRSTWQDWGMNGTEREGGDYRTASAYFFAAGGIPGVDSERHRLIGSLHAGWGSHVDRFSAKRLGGGQNTVGEEFESTSEPVLPGAARGEFFPRHYIVAFGEYRWEPAFFAYLGFNASVSRLDRYRATGTGIENRTDTLTSAGTRLMTGFFFNTRLELAYNYGFYLVRQGDYGAHELILHISKTF